ncbi:MAG: DUF2283 domain-containing protein [bacterium]|nr:DUF2283 domain-containing protein [bacterium]
MKATYDKEADAMYISVKKGKVHKTLEVSDAVNIDVDKKGRALGVEILYVSAQMARKTIEKAIRTGIQVSRVAA